MGVEFRLSVMEVRRNRVRKMRQMKTKTHYTLGKNDEL